MSIEVKAVASLAALYAFRMLGLFMVLPILVLYGSDYEGATPQLLGLALGIYGLTQALFQIPLGLLSDFIGRKPIILAGLCLFVLGSIIAAFSDSVLWLIVGRALQGSGAIASTIMALVGDLTSDKNRTKAMASIGASIGLSFVLAMILGPAIAGIGGLSSVFYLSACLAFIGIIITLFIIPTPNASIKNRDSATIPTLLADTLRNTTLLRLDIGIFVLHALLMASFLVVPALLETTYGLPRQSHWQAYLGLFGLSMLLVFPLIMQAEKKQKVKTIFLGAIATLTASLFCLSFLSPSMLFFWTVLFGFFVAFNLLEAMLPSLISKQSPAGGKGTAMGVYSTAQFLGAFVGGAGGGLILSQYGTQTLFIICAIMAAAWLLLAISMKTPKPLASWSTYLNTDTLLIDNELQTFYGKALLIDGVNEVYWSAQDKHVYLKLEKKHFDEAAFRKLISPMQ